jgi:hypothetical protein
MTAAKQCCVIVAGSGALSSLSEVSISGYMGMRVKGRMVAFAVECVGLLDQGDL